MKKTKVTYRSFLLQRVTRMSLLDIIATYQRCCGEQSPRVYRPPLAAGMSRDCLIAAIVDMTERQVTQGVPATAFKGLHAVPATGL